MKTGKCGECDGAGEHEGNGCGYCGETGLADGWHRCGYCGEPVPEGEEYCADETCMESRTLWESRAARSAFCANPQCGHSEALHHHPNVAAGRPCSLQCPCIKFERTLAVNTPTNAEKRAAIRLLKEKVLS